MSTSLRMKMQSYQRKKCNVLGRSADHPATKLNKHDLIVVGFFFVVAESGSVYESVINSIHYES